MKKKAKLNTIAGNAILYILIVIINRSTNPLEWGFDYFSLMCITLIGSVSMLFAYLEKIKQND